MDEFLLKEE